MSLSIGAFLDTPATIDSLKIDTALPCCSLWGRRTNYLPSAGQIAKKYTNSAERNMRGTAVLFVVLSAAAAVSQTHGDL